MPQVAAPTKPLAHTCELWYTEMTRQTVSVTIANRNEAYQLPEKPAAHAKS
jgi:hypothetical protein